MPGHRRTLLILGGSAEGFALAEALAGSPCRVITSLAGRTRERRLPAGEMRLGGFGGAGGLETCLRSEQVDVLIDATHPFAATISRNAAAAAEGAGVPLLRIARKPWVAKPGESWIDVPDLTAAAARIPKGPVFLTIGRTGLHAFAPRADLDFVARMIDPPETDPGIAHLRVVFGRGPFDHEAERRLFEENGIRCLVTKNSGGPAAKLDVARDLGIPVVMVQRPASIEPESAVHGVAEALEWLRDRRIPIIVAD